MIAIPHTFGQKMKTAKREIIVGIFWFGTSSKNRLLARHLQTNFTNFAEVYTIAPATLLPDRDVVVIATNGRNRIELNHI